MSKRWTTWVSALCLLAAAASAWAGEPGSAKNVILMISDGQGFNAVKAADLYSGAPAVYHSFPTQLAMQTPSADNPAGYDPAQRIADFDYVKTGATDSASAATAMYTGQKIHDGQINMAPDGAPLITFFEKAAQAGRSIGAVSSVQLSHATPAAVYGHNTSRNNYSELASEGVYGALPIANNAFYDAGNYHENMTVLMGAGHGDYDDNGAYDASKSNSYAGGDATWADILDGAAPNGWTFVENKADFEAIASGAAPAPAKLLGVAQVNKTLQQSRAAGAAPNTNVPTLETMTAAALNVLGQNPNGFAVMIEGGAVDWAGHANQLDRLIEEQTDFNNAVAAAVAWVEANSNWEQTLLIVTADHETGYLCGPGGYTDNGDGTITYHPLVDNGAGNLPGAEWFSGSHTNQLVPLFAKGAGSELFADHVIGADPNLAGYYGLDAGTWTGAYIDNTSIYSVMVEATNCPEPATMGLLVLGSVAAAAQRRRRRA